MAKTGRRFLTKAVILLIASSMGLGLVFADDPAPAKAQKSAPAPAPATAPLPTIKPEVYPVKVAYCNECQAEAAEYNRIAYSLRATEEFYNHALKALDAHSKELVVAQNDFVNIQNQQIAAAQAAQSMAAAQAQAQAMMPAQPATAQTNAPAKTGAPAAAAPAPAMPKTPVKKAAEPAKVKTPVAASAAPATAKAPASTPVAPTANTPPANPVPANQAPGNPAQANPAQANPAPQEDPLVKAKQRIMDLQNQITQDKADIKRSQSEIITLRQSRSEAAERSSLCEMQKCEYAETSSYPNISCKNAHGLEPIDIPMPTPMPHTTVRCDSCTKEATYFNDLTDKLYDVQKAIRTTTIEIDLDQKVMAKYQGEMDMLYPYRNRARHQSEYQAAVSHYNEAFDQYKQDSARRVTQQRLADNIQGQIQAAKIAQRNCEEDNCRHIVIKHLPPEGEHPKPYVPMEYQLGLFIGNTMLFRDATANSVYGRYTQSTRHDSGEFGGVINVLFGPNTKNQLLVYAMMLKMLGTSETLLAQEINPISASNSTLHVNYDWLARIGIGVNTKPIHSPKLRLQAGVAMAIIHQNAASSVIEGATGTHNRLDRKDIQPSLMGGLTYEICPTCFYQGPVLLSAQLFLDRYPYIGVSGATPAGTNYLLSADTHWELHEQLGLLVKF